MISTPEIGRLLGRVKIRQFGCWIWVGLLSRGYGQISWQGRQQQAHRVVYEMFVGPIPTDYELHHQCEVRACVRPDHLMPLTIKDHVAITASPAGENSRKTACNRGHPFTPENTYMWNGHRHCRQCQMLRSRAYRARGKSE
jgi:hypothetical protein